MQGVADALVASGLRDLGYVNVALDGGWIDFAGGGLNSSGFPVMPADWDIKSLAASFHAQGLKLGMYVTGGFKSVYRNEAKWAAVILGEWGTDGIKVDHMCDVPECIIPGQQPGHQMAVPTQQATIERWAAAIAAIGRTNDTLFQNCGIGCMPSAGPLSDTPAPWGEQVRNHEPTRPPLASSAFCPPLTLANLSGPWTICRAPSPAGAPRPQTCGAARATSRLFSASSSTSTSRRSPAAAQCPGQERGRTPIASKSATLAAASVLRRRRPARIFPSGALPRRP